MSAAANSIEIVVFMKNLLWRMTPNKVLGCRKTAPAGLPMIVVNEIRTAAQASPRLNLIVCNSATFWILNQCTIAFRG
jgi:hypothetical protein